MKGQRGTTPMNERRAVIIGLVGIFTFEFITLIFVLFNYAWQTMYLMQWVGFFGSIAYSIYQFKWIDKLNKRQGSSFSSNKEKRVSRIKTDLALASTSRRSRVERRVRPESPKRDPTKI